MASPGELSTDAAERIVAGLWPTQPEQSRVLLGSGVRSETAPNYEGPGHEFKDRELAKALRERGPVPVLVVRRLSPTLLRALRRDPVDLLVLLEDRPDLGDEPIEKLAHRVLGPFAVLRVDTLESRGGAIACAYSAQELRGMTRALADRTLALRIAPTPPWLHELLGHPTLRPLPIAGTIGRAALHSGWIPWARDRTAPHVLVPLGIEAPRLSGNQDDDTPEVEEALVTAAAAHALERTTGPVFPAPRVIAGVLEGLEHAGGRAAPSPTADQLAVWTQARRALPVLGAAAGMGEPHAAAALQAPTAAFLAQRVLLRARAHYATQHAAIEPLAELDEDGLERSTELLRNAAGVLTDHESKVVLRGFGFEVTRQAVANSASGAAGFADRIGYPVVLKALSPDLRRRTDVGGVVLSLSTASAVRRGYATVVDNVERSAPTARIDGIVVAEMVPDGIDIRCGARRLDNDQVVAYGRVESRTGAVEPVLAMLPLKPADAVALAHSVLSRAPLPALRRHNDPDVPGLAEVFLRISALFDRTDERVLGVDLGPVRMLEPPRGLVILDARITQRAHLEGL